LTEKNKKLQPIYGNIFNSIDKLNETLLLLKSEIDGLHNKNNNISKSANKLLKKVNELKTNSEIKRKKVEKNIEETNKKITKNNENIDKINNKLLSPTNQNEIDRLNDAIKILEFNNDDLKSKIAMFYNEKLKLTKIITYLNDIDINIADTSLYKCNYYYTQNQTKLETDLPNSFKNFNDTVKNTSVFQNGCKEIMKNINIVFYEMEKFISIFIKKECYDFNIDEQKNYELHRIKIGMYGLLNLSIQNFDGKRNGGTFLGYFHSNKSFSFMMGISQLFKKFKKDDLKHDYDGINNVFDILSDTAIKETKDNKFKINDYSLAFEEKHEETRININTEIIYGKYYDASNKNISLYQLIEYLNKDMVFNMGEKLHDYLVSIGEIEKLPSIDFILEYLKSGTYFDKDKIVKADIKLNKYNCSISSNIYRTDNIDDTKLKNTNFQRNFLNKNCDNPNNLINMVNTFDSNNRIKFDTTKIFELIDTFDKYGFIKYFFKTVRDTNVLISPNISAFKYTPIPFDDLFYYRQHIDFKYKLDEETPLNIPFYYGFFTLGSMCTFTGRTIDEFSNKANELMVRIIEFTNGTL
jgi:hypothetical protein